MAKQTRKKRKTTQNNNRIWIFVSIIIVIAILSMLISYFLVDEDKPDVFLLPSDNETEVVQTPAESAKPVTTPIDGTWVSNYDGAMLTISGTTFSLEVPGVDEGSKITGSFTFELESNICTFVNEGGNATCKGNEGHYLYGRDDSGDINFELIKDICESRKERMSASWFKL